MSYPKQLAILRPYKGVVSDQPASEVSEEYATDAYNVRFSTTAPERVRGYREAYASPTVAPLALLSVQRADSDRWVYAAEASQWSVSIAGHADITRATGVSTQLEPSSHSLCSLNGIAIHNNALDAPMYSDGIAPFEDLPGWEVGTVCQWIVAHRYHLFALDLDTAGGRFGSLLRWSDAAEPGSIPSTWVPAADNQAGSAELADTPARIMTAATLRDTLLIYKRDAVYACDYVGGDTVYSFRPLFRGIGAISSRAVAESPQGHVFVSDGDVYFTDGNTQRSIATGRVRERIFGSLNSDRLQDLIAYYQPLRRETIIGFPTGEGRYCNEVAVWSHDADAWSLGDGDDFCAIAEGVIVDAATVFPNTWDTSANSWDVADTGATWNDSGQRLVRQVIVCMPDLKQLRLIDTADPISIQAWIEHADLPLGDPARWKYLRRVHVRWRGVGTLTLRVATRDTVGDAQTSLPPVTVPAGDQVVNIRALGRFITLRLESSGVEPWGLVGLAVEYEMRGYQ